LTEANVIEKRELMLAAKARQVTADRSERDSRQVTADRSERNYVMIEHNYVMIVRNYVITYNRSVIT
jgi:hypothetical protein